MDFTANATFAHYLTNYPKPQTPDFQKFRVYTENSRRGETMKLKDLKLSITYGIYGSWRRKKGTGVREGN